MLLSLWGGVFVLKVFIDFVNLVCIYKIAIPCPSAPIGLNMEIRLMVGFHRWLSETSELLESSDLVTRIVRDGARGDHVEERTLRGEGRCGNRS